VTAGNGGDRECLRCRRLHGGRPALSERSGIDACAVKTFLKFYVEKYSVTHHLLHNRAGDRSEIGLTVPPRFPPSNILRHAHQDLTDEELTAAAKLLGTESPRTHPRCRLTGRSAAGRRCNVQGELRSPPRASSHRTG
jgi:hypothetical protein